MIIEKTASRPTLVDGVVLWPPGMVGRGRWRCQEAWERVFLPMSELVGKTARQIVYAKRSAWRLQLRMERERGERLNSMRGSALRRAAGIGG